VPLPTLALERAAVLYNLAALYANLVRSVLVLDRHCCPELT
jgi:hypothetical protein